MDEFEWATFVMKNFPDFMTPELADALTKLPRKLDNELLDYWDRIMNDPYGIVGEILEVVCLSCYNITKKLHPVTKSHFKGHFITFHCT